MAAPARGSAGWRRIRASGRLGAVFAGLLVVGGLTAPARGAPPAFEGEATLLAEAAEKTLALAGWCQTAGLLAERDRLARVLLRLDRDHEQARKWLRHRRAKDGSWAPDPAAKPSKDANAKARAALPDQRKKAYGETLATLFERAQPLVGGNDAPSGSRVVELLVDLDPDDARFRELQGDVRQGTGWVLAETARARERRRALASLSTQTLQGVGVPAAGSPSAVAAGLGLRWSRTARGAHVTVLTTGAPAEADRVARYMDAALALAREVLTPSSPIPGGTVVCLLSSAEERKLVLDKQNLSAKEREWHDALFAHWLGDDHLIVGPHDEASRLEACVRQAVDLVLRAGLGFDVKAAWLRDGVGTYMTWLLTGTRLTFLIRASRYAEDEKDAKDRQERKERNWLIAARRLDEAGRLPELAWVAGLDLNNLAREDALLGYVAAAWLIEGHEDRYRAFLERSAAGDPLHDVVGSVLGLDLIVADRRVRRWLEENT